MRRMAPMRSISSAGGTRSSATCTREASRWPMRPTSSAGECIAWVRRCVSAANARLGPGLFYDGTAHPPLPTPRPHSVNPEHAYDEMIRLSKEEALLASCLELLEWDEEV